MAGAAGCPRSAKCTDWRHMTTNSCLYLTKLRQSQGAWFKLLVCMLCKLTQRSTYGAVQTVHMTVLCLSKHVSSATCLLNVQLLHKHKVVFHACSYRSHPAAAASCSGICARQVLCWGGTLGQHKGKPCQRPVLLPLHHM